MINTEKGIMKYAFGILTNRCNLACTYCYEKNKGTDRMTLETLVSSIDMIFSNITKEDKNAGFTFFGGEPTLEMDLILEAVKYIGEKQKLYRKLLEDESWSFNIGIITNAVIFNEKMVDYVDLLKLYDIPVQIQLSIDGTPECQDMYRVFPDGSGSSDVVFKNLKSYIELVKSRGLRQDCINIHPCLNKSTLPKLYEIFKYYVDMGFDSLWAMPVHSENWDSEDFKIYKEELLKIYEHIDMEKERELRYATFKCFEEGTGKPTMTCQAGNRSFGINWNGDIYACHHLIFTGGKPIGNVIDGIDQEKLMLERKQDMDLIGSSFKKCKDCDYNTCYRCWAENRTNSGDDNCIPDNYCRLAYIEKEVIKIIEERELKVLLLYKPFKVIDEITYATNQLYDSKSLYEEITKSEYKIESLTEELEKILKYIQEETRNLLTEIELKGGDTK